MNSYYYNFNEYSNAKLLMTLIVLICATTDSNSQPISSVASSSAGLFSISPNFSITETWTDNLALENGVKKSGWITEVSPGVSVKSGFGRIKGYLNYSLNSINYSSGREKNSLQNSLNSSINIEAIEGHGFIDITGAVTQQTVSAFGIQNQNSNVINSNKTEFSVYSLTPYYRGRLYNFLNYDVRYNVTTNRAKNTRNFSSNSSLASISISGDEIFGKLSWVLGVNRQKVSRDIAEDTEIDSLKISLNYPIINSFIFSVTGGREMQNYTSAENNSSWTSGIGLNWSISEMTKLSANVSNSPLGKMHSLNFEHRTPRTSWRVSDVKNVSITSGRNSLNLGGSYYDLLFSQFSSIEPDLVKRAQLVNNYLQAYGINPNSIATNGYLTSGVSLQRAQNISFALLGLRDTITFTAAQSVGTGVISSTGLADDFSSASSIRQNGITVAYTHRLTPDTVISNQFSVQKTYGQLSSQNSRTRSTDISASTRIGMRAYLTVSARHSTSSSNSFPYKETAVTGKLTVQF